MGECPLLRMLGLLWCSFAHVDERPPLVWDGVVSVQCVKVDPLPLLRLEVFAAVNTRCCNHTVVCGVLCVSVSLAVAHPLVGVADVGV